MVSRRELALWAYVLASGVLAERSAVLVHELAHGVAAWGLGATPRGIIVTVAGGGLADYTPPPGWSWQASVVAAAGILANLLVGSLAFVALRRARQAHLATILCACAAANVPDALAYATWGAYTGEGDLADAVALTMGSDALRTLRTEGSSAWIALAAAVAVSSYLIVTAYVPALDRLAPPSSRPGRLARAVLAVGVPALVLCGAKSLVAHVHHGQNPGGFHATARAARQDALWGEAVLAEVRRSKVDEPDLALPERQAHMRAWMDAHPVQSIPTPRTIPLEALLPLLVGLGAVAALIRPPAPGRSGSPARVPASAFAGVTGGAVILLVMLLAGRERLSFDPSWDAPGVRAEP